MQLKHHLAPQTVGGSGPYGSMLSEIIKRLLAGMSLTDLVAFIIQYIKDHYLPSPVPVPPASGMIAKGADLGFLTEYFHRIIQDCGPAKKAAVGLTLPEIISYIIETLRLMLGGTANDILKEVELQLINGALVTIIPALRAQNNFVTTMLANLLEGVLLKLKAELENQPA